MTLGLAAVVLKLITLAVLLYLVSFYLRLGLVLPLVCVVGAVLAVVVTAPQWKTAAAPRLFGSGVAAVSIACQICVFALMTTESVERFWMRPGVTGTLQAAQAGEVVLEFEDFRGNIVALYSDQVADYLAASGQDRVEVEFVVTRDSGCLRGFHETRIGILTSWTTSSAGHFGSSDGAAPPWSDPWWCP